MVHALGRRVIRRFSCSRAGSIKYSDRSVPSDRENDGQQVSYFDLMEVKEGRRVIEHNSNHPSRRGSSTSRILDPWRNDSMVSDSDVIVLFDERHFGSEARVHATSSLSTRQSPEAQIRGWPELDRFLVARPPSPKPNPGSL